VIVIGQLQLEHPLPAVALFQSDFSVIVIGQLQLEHPLPEVALFQSDCCFSFYALTLHRHTWQEMPTLPVFLTHSYP
jgi:hypothetical protein